MRGKQVLYSGVLGVALAGGALAVVTHNGQQVPGRHVYVASTIAAVQMDPQTGHALVLTGAGSDGHGYASLPGVTALNPATGVTRGVFSVPDTPCAMVVDARTRRAFITVMRDVIAYGADSVAEDLYTFDLDTHRRIRRLTLTQPTTAQILAARAPYGWGFGCVHDQLAVDEGANRVFVARSIAYTGGSPSPLITVLDARTGTPLRTIHLPSSATRPAVGATIAISARTHHAFIPAKAGAALWMLDTRAGALVHTANIGRGDWHAIAVDDASGRAVVGTGALRSGSVAVIDTRSGRLLRTITVGSEPTSMAVDGRRQRAFLFVDRTTLHHALFSVATLDLQRGRILHTASVGQILSTALDTQRGHLYVLARDVNDSGRDEISEIDERTGKILLRIPAGTYAGQAILTPDHRRLIVTGAATCSFSLPLWPCDGERGIVTILGIPRSSPPGHLQ